MCVIKPIAQRRPHHYYNGWQERSPFKPAHSFHEFEGPGALVYSCVMGAQSSTETGCHSALISISIRSSVKLGWALEPGFDFQERNVDLADLLFSFGLNNCRGIWSVMSFVSSSCKAYRHSVRWSSKLKPHKLTGQTNTLYWNGKVFIDHIIRHTVNLTVGLFLLE